jgi:uncharacterized protein YdaU (DUF1376 family)
MEHGAYNLLLHHYYGTDGCLAGEKPRLYRLCGATSPEEQRSVDYVITRFFPIIQGKLTNNRADREIEGRRQFLEEQSRKGRLGGRPKGKPNESRGKAEAKAGGKPKGKPGESLPAPAPVPDPEPRPSPEPKDQERIVTRPGNGRFTPPTLDDVSDYCKARENRVDPIKFHAHYTANGWRVGKNPMKNWKAAIVTWERNNA